MDIEQLTKAQIILLTLLVSFVTSIATGIVTVTLLDQAPPVITQTINRVVEKTVERIIPGETQSATVITKETTIVVNEEDLLTQAIEKNVGRIAKIYQHTSSGSVFVGLGVIVAKNGVVAVATDTSLITGESTFSITLSDGREFETEIFPQETNSPTTLLGISFTEEDGVIPAGIEYGDINALKLGQTVLTISGSSRINIATGIISGLDEKEIELKVDETAGEDNNESEPIIVSVLEVIETNLGSEEINKGGPLLNIFGEVIGISTAQSRVSGAQYFTPIQVVQSQIIVAAEERQAQKE